MGIEYGLADSDEERRYRDRQPAIDEIPGDLEALKKVVELHKHKIKYSKYYTDDTHHYRHVTLPPEITEFKPPKVYLREKAWRQLGICMSPGWIHVLLWEKEPHVILFRKDKEPEDSS